MQAEDGVFVNAMFSGRAAFRAANGKRGVLIARSSYPREGRMLMTVEAGEGPLELTLRLRIPEDLPDAEILVDGVRQEELIRKQGYVCLKGIFSSGNTVEIRGQIPVIRETIDGSDAFRYGCVVLARDEAKEPGFDSPVLVPDGPLSWRMLPPEQDEMVRILIDQKPGLPPLLMTDYASCGKRWNLEKNRVTVWMRRSTAGAPAGDGKNGE